MKKIQLDSAGNSEYPHWYENWHLVMYEAKAFNCL